MDDFEDRSTRLKVIPVNDTQVLNSFVYQYRFELQPSPPGYGRFHTGHYDHTRKPLADSNIESIRQAIENMLEGAQFCRPYYDSEGNPYVFHNEKGEFHALVFLRKGGVIL